MKDVNKVVMVIIGTLIGAGFASGREIYLFFNRFGYFGIIGIIISGITTASIIYVVLEKTRKKQINNYANLLEEINPKYPKINAFFSIIVNSFILISFFIMVAGFSAYMKQTYQIETYLSSILFVLFCYVVFRKNLQGIMKINEYLVPFLLFFIIFLGIKNIPYLLETKQILQVETKRAGFLISSLLYASYNSIILIPILVNMKQFAISKAKNILISIISALSIIILSFCIYGLLLKGQFYIQELELPLLQISLEYGKIFYYIYGFVIIFSIFTSAVATGYSFLENVRKDDKSYNRNLIIISIIAILVSNIGFSNLVQTLYPLFGVLGLIQVIIIFNKR